jgi:hypothetical protein
LLLPDIGTEIASKRKKLDKDAEAEKNNYFKILNQKRAYSHLDTTFKGLRFIRKDVEYVIMDNKINCR